MNKTVVMATLLTMGCATADSVKGLEEKMTALEAKVESLEKAPKATAKAGKTEDVDKEAESSAQALLKEAQTLMESNKIKEAKAKLTELESKYSSTRTFRRSKKIAKELEVFGKEAPAKLEVEEWYVGNGNSIDLAKGTTLLVFWEIWCPHCKREVPNLQKTYDEYNKKGLQMVGLTKLSRSATKEKVVSFLTESNVTYPVAKEGGALSSHFNVSGIPAAAVVKDGKIVWRGHPARLTNEQLDSWL
jgi:thiol-disulfide isomerase/thioredoxin